MSTALTINGISSEDFLKDFPSSLRNLIEIQSPSKKDYKNYVPPKYRNYKPPTKTQIGSDVPYISIDNFGSFGGGINAAVGDNAKAYQMSRG